MSIVAERRKDQAEPSLTSIPAAHHHSNINTTSFLYTLPHLRSSTFLPIIISTSLGRPVVFSSQPVPADLERHGPPPQHLVVRFSWMILADELAHVVLELYSAVCARDWRSVRDECRATVGERGGVDDWRAVAQFVSLLQSPRSEHSRRLWSRDRQPVS